MKNLLKSNVYGSCEQCMSVLFTLKSQQNWLKKKTENAKCRKRQRRERNPNSTYIFFLYSACLLKFQEY